MDPRPCHKRYLWVVTVATAVATSFLCLSQYSSGDMTTYSGVLSTSPQILHPTGNTSLRQSTYVYGDLTPEYLSVRGKRIQLPDGLRATQNYNYTNFYVIRRIKNIKEAEQWYNDYSKLQPLECAVRSKLGHTQDGGWDTCLIAPYIPSSPCLVYSFGINRDWSFDETISEQYGCHVKAFDPSIHLDTHKHSDKIWFYPHGLDGSNYVNKKNWTMKTLQTFLQDLGDTKTVIDYLKVDIEGSEWPAFKTALSDGVFRWVKQFSFEAHTIFAPHTKKYEWHTMFTVLRDLNTHGFKQWYIHPNIHTIYVSEFDNGFLTYAKEYGYLNINFLDPQYEADLVNGNIAMGT